MKYIWTKSIWKSQLDKMREPLNHFPALFFYAYTEYLKCFFSSIRAFILICCALFFVVDIILLATNILHALKLCDISYLTSHCTTLESTFSEQREREDGAKKITEHLQSFIMKLMFPELLLLPWCGDEFRYFRYSLISHFASFHTFMLIATISFQIEPLTISIAFE